MRLPETSSDRLIFPKRSLICSRVSASIVSVPGKPPMSILRTPRNSGRTRTRPASTAGSRSRCTVSRWGPTSSRCWSSFSRSAGASTPRTPGVRRSRSHSAWTSSVPFPGSPAPQNVISSPGSRSIRDGTKPPSTRHEPSGAGLATTRTWVASSTRPDRNFSERSCAFNTKTPSMISSAGRGPARLPSSRGGSNGKSSSTSPASVSCAVIRALFSTTDESRGTPAVKARTSWRISIERAARVGPPSPSRSTRRSRIRTPSSRSTVTSPWRTRVPKRSTSADSAQPASLIGSGRSVAR